MDKEKIVIFVKYLGLFMVSVRVDGPWLRSRGRTFLLR
jgi:hypothetical protein